MSLYNSMPIWLLFPLFANALSTYYHWFSYSLWFVALRVFWAAMCDEAISAEFISCFPCMHIMHLLLETFETAGSLLCISLFLLDTVSVQRKEGSRKLNLNCLGFRKHNGIPKIEEHFPSPLLPPPPPPTQISLLLCRKALNGSSALCSECLLLSSQTWAFLFGVCLEPDTNQMWTITVSAGCKTKGKKKNSVEVEKFCWSLNSVSTLNNIIL